jgi:hypothetical protein
LADSVGDARDLAGLPGSEEEVSLRFFLDEIGNQLETRLAAVFTGDGPSEKGPVNLLPAALLRLLGDRSSEAPLERIKRSWASVITNDPGCRIE